MRDPDTDPSGIGGDVVHAHAAEFRVGCRVVLIGSPGMKNAAWTVFLQTGGILLAGIVEFLGFLLCVAVIEVAEPFIEAMHGRQEFVAISETVLSELGGRISLRLAF